MKNIRTFENHEAYGNIPTKEYGQEFPMAVVKIGTEIIYAGSPFIVDKNDGFILVAKSVKTGSIAKMNQNMFNQRVLIK